MFYLAEALSDFYIPVSEMPEHKIQSSGGLLQITMKMVPKIPSSLVTDLAPKVFIISFKLVTDPSPHCNCADNTLEVYQHQVVVANIFESEINLLLSDDKVEKGIEIKEKIVDNLQSQHTTFIRNKN
ncbi:phosphopantothenate--cysteine ligase-like [Otolemur garnettii]|uniref:phosphopantothenate--cysteine ligase-like n=1 Tax=Otolemur garnettii TaxID=30611 RepID=UPI00027403C1|nr:phosphopantothenate--cysteine ligase-like [Otolemur garnettii]